MRRNRDGLEFWFYQAAGFFVVALIMSAIVACCVVSCRDAEVRDGVIVAKDYSPGYFYYTSSQSGGTAIWQPAEYRITLRGHRIDTGQQRDANVQVSPEEYSHLVVGQEFHR